MTWADSFIPPVSNKPICTPLLPQYWSYNMPNYAQMPCNFSLFDMGNMNNFNFMNMPLWQNTSFYGYDNNAPIVPYSQEGWDKHSDEEKNQINMKASERSACIKQEKEDLEEEHSKEHNLGASLGFSSLFVAPSVYKAAKGKFYGANQNVTEVFYSLDQTTKQAKYAKYFSEYPKTMIEAQEALSKASRQAASALSHAKNPSEIQAIKAGYAHLKTLMENALKSGSADQIAQATEKIKAANKITYRKLFRLSNNKKYIVTKEHLTKKAGATAGKAVAQKGNSFVSHLGGKVGLGMGALMAGASLYFSKDEIKEAYAIDKKTGKEQLKQSITKAIVPVATFTVGDALGKWFTTKVISKGVTKLATKLVAKGAGKAIGAAIGSCVPGIGTAIGLAVGCVLDWAVSKWVIPAIFKGENSTLENKKIAQKSNEELLQTIALKKMQGKTLTQMEQNILNKNQTYYNSFIATVQAQQQTA